MDPRTRCARGVGGPQEPGRARAPVIVTSSLFDFENQAAVDRYYERGEGYIYSRYENPTVRGAERFLAELEGAEEAACFASGMAAISTLLLAMAGAGERVAAQRELYGGSFGLLDRVLPATGIEVLWIDREEIASGIDPERLRDCRVLYLESPTNPGLRIVDLRRAAEAAHAAGALAAVDGTFATPVLQKPLELGLDLVVHSATKYLGGHGDMIGGVVAGRSELVGKISLLRRSLGGTMDPFSAFLLQRGMRTLAVRMEAHCRGAEAVARFLASHPGIERVSYPGLQSHPDHELAARQMTGFGGMVTFAVPGGLDGATKVHDRLRLFTRAASLGGTESLVSIPARMSHRGLSPEALEKAGVVPGMLRLSVGLEAPDDLVEDLARALD